MGVYYRVHVGPALVCKFHYSETITKEIKKTSYRVCSNEGCERRKVKNEVGNKQTAKFCSSCGSPVTVVTEEKEVEKKKKKKSVEGVYDLFDERPDLRLGNKFGSCMCGLDNDEFIKDAEILLPHEDKILGRDVGFEANQFALHIRGTPDVAGEIAKYEQHYAKELAFLRSRYDEVTVEWLVLTTGS